MSSLCEDIMMNFKVNARFSCLLILLLLSLTNANDSTAFTFAPSSGSWSTETPLNVTSASLGGEDKTVNRRVSDVIPCYGPVSGGTNITISGEELTCSASLQVHLIENGIRINCQDVIATSATTITCVTLNISQPLPLRVEVSCEGHQSAGILWATNDSVWFHYRSNPSIQGVYPGVSILAGGITQTVYGDNLDSVAQPIITMTPSRSSNGAPQQMEQETCKIGSVSNSTIWKCPMPAVEGATDVSVHPEIVTIGFLLDGFSKYLNHTTAQILEDPKIQHFNPDPMEFIANENNLITIGVDFPMNFSSDDVSVIIGRFICEDVQLLEQKTITCRPPPLASSVIRYGPSEKNTLPVTVTIGKFQKVVGHLHYVSRKSFHVIMIVMIAIIIFIFLVSFIFGCFTLFASKTQGSTKSLARRSKRKTTPFRTEETEFGTTDEGQEESPQSDSVGRKKPRRNAKDSQDSKVVCLAMHDRENI